MFTGLLGLQPGIILVPHKRASPIYLEVPNKGMSLSTGGREAANGFQIDSSNANNALNTGATVVFNQDSIAEFRVLTGNFDAEYANYGGGMGPIKQTKNSHQHWHSKRGTSLGLNCRTRSNNGIQS